MANTVNAQITQNTVNATVVQNKVEAVMHGNTDEMVKATQTDPSPGYLSDKVDNQTIQVTNNKLEVKPNTFLKTAGDDFSQFNSKTTLDDNDRFLIEDSADANNKKISLFSTIKNVLKSFFDTIYLIKSGDTATGTITFSGYTDIELNGQRTRLSMFDGSNFHWLRYGTDDSDLILGIARQAANKYWFYLRGTGNRVLSLGDGNGNSINIDIAAGAGLSNIVAGAYWDGSQYVYEGGRGASRVELSDGWVALDTSNVTAGTAGNPVTWKPIISGNSSGNVGIRTQNIAKNITLRVANGEAIRLGQDNQFYIDWVFASNRSEAYYKNTAYSATAAAFSVVHSDAKFKILNKPGQAGSKAAITVDRDSGNVGMNTTNPTQQLYVVGNIYATGSITSGSDKKLKRNIKPLSGVLSRLQKISGYRFVWNKVAGRFGFPTGKRDMGLIAQEVEKVFPEVVTTVKHPDKDGKTRSYKTINYIRFVAILVEAIKELYKENQQLKKRITKLEKRLEKLEKLVVSK